MTMAAWQTRTMGVLALALGMAACGDPETYDDRGYTKAPLERAGLPVRGEPETQMDALGTPNYPVIKVIEAPDSGAAAPAAS